MNYTHSFETRNTPRKDFAQHHNLRITPRAPGTTQPFQDISRTARDILEYLWRLTDDGKNLTKVTQVRLAQEFCVTRMTINRLLGQLQEKGYIFPALRNGFMVIHWAVSLKAKYIGQTIKTLPMVKWASQSIKDFLKSVKQALINKGKQGGGCNIFVTHTSLSVITNGDPPPVPGCEPPEKPSVTGEMSVSTNKTLSWEEQMTSDYPSDEEISRLPDNEQVNINVQMNRSILLAANTYANRFDKSPTIWLMKQEEAGKNARTILAKLRHANKTYQELR